MNISPKKIMSNVQINLLRIASKHFLASKIMESNWWKCSGYLIIHNLIGHNQGEEFKLAAYFASN